jgi:hypothetical protein
MSSLTSVKLTSYLCCCVLMTDEREGREAMLERLILAISDMADTAAAARFLLGPHSGIADFPWHAHRALETGMFSSDARAFNESKGCPPLPAAPTSSLSRRERETHKWALDERQKVWAHVDRAGHRRSTQVQQRPPVAFLEEWISPTPDQLEALGALAEKLQERYRVEAEEVWRELQK